MKKGHKYGTHRVISPKGVLPQPADKLDNNMDEIYDNEILIDVQTLNIDSASFTQSSNQAGGDIRDFVFLRGSIPADATYTVAGVGRYEFPLAALAIIDGGHVRVGFEDNVYLSKGVPAKSNGELVEKVVRMAKEFGREVATPDEARRILGLKK